MSAIDPTSDGTETRHLWQFNEVLTTDLLTGFVRDEIHKVGLKRAILGLSGGIDSALVAFLAARALGPENVYCILMPYRTSSRESLSDAKLVVDQLKVHSTVVEITPMVDAYFARFPEADTLRRGNVMARMRMITLYDLSAQHSALVLGTSNKTELLLGYGTLFGDMASALNPVGDLYKNEVRTIARYLNVPPSIISKAPSADLWVGQSDEVDLGFSYDEVDRVLVELVDRRVAPEVLIERGFDEKFILDVWERVRRSQFKRRPPIIAKVSSRSVIHDFKYKRDWGY